MTKSNSRKSKSANGKGKKLAGKLPALVQQPHGGALLSGGVPGHKGGGGRPPDVIRKRCRESFDKRIPILEQIADDQLTDTATGKKVVGKGKPRVRDRIMAIDQLAKVGLGGDTKIVAAQADTPEGYRFTLILGERGQS